MRTRQTMMVSATALTVTAALAIGGVSPAFADPTNEKTGSITCPTGRTAVLKTSDWGGGITSTVLAGPVRLSHRRMETSTETSTQAHMGRNAVLLRVCRSHELGNTVGVATTEPCCGAVRLLANGTT